MSTQQIKLTRKKMAGVWSACPTPFTEKMKIDQVAVRRMVEHHKRLGVTGLFLAGSSGEGPWITTQQRHCLIQTAAKWAKGKLILAAQVTDNSSARVLDNIRAAQKDGADIAIMAEPYMVEPKTPEVLLNLYREAIQESPLPMGVYDRGVNATTFIPNPVLKEIYKQKNVVLIKDSSADSKRQKIALQARNKRPSLCLLNGNEFDCISYLQAGYDGLLLGGGVFNGHLARQIMLAVADGDIAKAQRLQKQMNCIMHAVYGGRDFGCWMSGMKKLLVEMGIFRTWKNYLGFPLTKSCCKAIEKVLERDADSLRLRNGKSNA